MSQYVCGHSNSRYILNSAWKSELRPFELTLFQKLASCGLCDCALTKKSCYLDLLDQTKHWCWCCCSFCAPAAARSCTYGHSKEDWLCSALLTLLWSLSVPMAGDRLPFLSSFSCLVRRWNPQLLHTQNQFLGQVTNHFPLCRARIWPPMSSRVGGRNNSSDDHQHLVGGRKY